MRQALAGMLWTKQYYYFDADTWLEEHRAHPLHPPSRAFRNRDWFHMVNDDIISMPDKWEYPWYAAWDLAFHTIALSIVDPDFAKQQLDLMLTGHYLHPNGQIPAYEWNFSDVNPPVHAWATLFLTRTEEALHGEVDLEFLKSAYHKLLLNFTWWVNRKDRSGKNVFEGGFLGLDNIGVFDRSASLPTGGHLEQADGTAWMALFCQNMGELALELTAYDPTYETMVEKFIDHFLWIAAGMNGPGEEGMWDEEDGFYYDNLVLPDGGATRLKVRSLVGLLPLCATTVVEPWQRERVPRVVSLFQERLRQMPQLQGFIHPTGPGYYGVGERGILALLTPERLRRVLANHARRGGVSQPLRHPLALQISRTTSLRVSRGGTGIPRRVFAGGVGQRDVRRQLQLARADLVAGERPHHPSAAGVLSLLRRRVSGGMPHRFREDADPLRGGP